MGGKANTPRKTAEEVAEEEGNQTDGHQKTIAFAAAVKATKIKASTKSALRKGAKESVKVFKYELIVTVRTRISYKRGKSQVRHKVYAAISNSLKLIREDLLEGKGAVAILGKEGRKSTKPPIRTATDFPKTSIAFKRDYASLANPYVFIDGKKGNTKPVEMCLVPGMDVDVAQVLKDGESDITEQGVEIRAKPFQVIDTYDKHMILGVPTSIPPNVVKQQLIRAMNDSEERVRGEKLGLYDKSLHGNRKPVVLELSRKFPIGIPFIQWEEDEVRPNNGRQAFVIQVKLEQEPRLRSTLKEMKDTNGLKNHLYRTVWTIEMQSTITDNDAMFVRKKREKAIEVVYTHGSCMLNLGHTHVPRLRNIEQKYRIRQTKEDGSVRCLRKSLSGILLYLK